jgi:hypothetical protein
MPFETPSALGRQKEEAAVCGIDMEPESLPLAEVGEAFQIVHRSGVRRARVADDEERASPGGAVLLDQLRQRVEPDAKGVVRRNDPDASRGETHEHRGLLDRVMGLVRGVEDSGQEIFGKTFATRRDERREGRERAPGRQEPAGCGGITEDVAEPAHDVRFELREPGSRLENADVAVDGVGHEVGDRGVDDAAPRDVREVSGPRGAEALADHPVEHEVEQLLVRTPALGQRLDERSGEVRSAVRVRRRLP